MSSSVIIAAVIFFILGFGIGFSVPLFARRRHATSELQTARRELQAAKDAVREKSDRIIGIVSDLEESYTKALSEIKSSVYDLNEISSQSGSNFKVYPESQGSSSFFSAAPHRSERYYNEAGPVVPGMRRDEQPKTDLSGTEAAAEASETAAK
ncbi:MAG: hypothetical protein SPL69_05675 [Succinivibrionaceae bacterium]|jgi:hypothetical protein|nr:hypothetical protein [Succinivibrionaceae bacterium]